MNLLIAWSNYLHEGGFNSRAWNMSLYCPQNIPVGSLSIPFGRSSRGVFILPLYNLQNIRRMPFRSRRYAGRITDNNGRHYLTIHGHSNVIKDFAVTDMSP